MKYRSLRKRGLFTAIAVVLLMGGTAYADDDATANDGDKPQQLEPIIVEGQQTPLDMNRMYRDRLPCMGSCDEEDKPTSLQKLLKGIETLFIASQIPEKPTPVDNLHIQNPTGARLQEKLP